MTVTNTLTLNIEEKAHNYAKIYASLLNDEFQRKRAYASIVALYALVNALEKTDINIQKSMTLFRNPKLNERYEISDLYVNNYHIDVRVIVDGDAVLLPKTHFENNILPDYYAVIKVDKTLKSAVLVGFLKTDGIKTEPFDYHYFSAALENVISYDEFLLNVNAPKVLSFLDKEHELFQNSYLALMDDEIDKETNNKLLGHLFSCPECRAEFCCFTGFEMVSCNSSKYPELISDKTLDIIGANAVEDEKYAGKEESVYIGDENNIDNAYEEKSDENSLEDTVSEQITEVEEEKEETVSDILDELFSIDEMTEGTSEEDKSVEIKPAANMVEEENESAPKLVTEEENAITETEEVAISPDDEVINEEQYPMPMFKDEEDEIGSGEKYDDGELNSDDNDIDKIYDDDSDNNIEYVEENDVDMQVIPSDETPEDSTELNVSEEEPDLVLYHNEEVSENDTTAKELSAQDKSDVQKVIVDYDEYGEPIYSYITNVSNDEEQTENIAISDDENVLNEEFEVYAPEEDSEITNIKNGSSRPVEYVEADDITEDADILDDSTSEISTISEVEDISSLDDDNDNWEEEAQRTAEAENEEPVAETEIAENVDEEVTDIEEDYANEDLTEGKTVPGDDLEEESSSEDENNEEYETSDSEEDDDFEEYDEDSDEIGDETIQDGSKGKRSAVIAMIIILLVLVSSGFGIFAFFKHNSNNVTEVNNGYQENNTENNFFENGENGQNEQPEENNDMFGEPAEIQGEIIPAEENGEELPPPPETNEQPEEINHVEPLTEQDLIVTRNNEPVSDVNTAITNAFSNNGNTVSVRNVNWLCTPKLFTDSAFKNYLQNLDNILKLNLRKNVLDATEMPQNDVVSVKMAVDNSGNLLKYVISDSSGSEQIDEIVLRSIKETFDGEKAQILNDSALKADKYYLKVVIKI